MWITWYTSGLVADPPVVTGQRNEGVVGLSGLGQARGRVLALAAAIVAILAGGTWVALTQASAEQGTANAAAAHQSTAKQASKTHAPPLTVTSITPAAHAQTVDGAAPIRVVFSSPLAANSPWPTLSPSIDGTWTKVNSRTIVFHPVSGFSELTHVRLTIPAGSNGMKSAKGGQLAAPVVQPFRTGQFSTMRLEQLLAQLGYLPLTWQQTPGDVPLSAADENGQLSAAYSPPAGTFLWQPGYPAKLQSFWAEGKPSLILTGAVMAFEADHSLTMDGVAGRGVWSALLSAVAKGQNNPHGYTYALASQVNPETLTVWHNGKVVLHTLANTGIPAAPTTIGTAPVYLRYTFQIMKGTNPDGTKYADPVSWVSYFRSGEAVHYFPRGSYGFQQSLGCVELPLAQAKFVWPYMTYGTLVTVTAP
jgi:peptidoglycan hydrolase-like protein with peptidoglycan-binding domain